MANRKSIKAITQPGQRPPGAGHTGKTGSLAEVLERKEVWNPPSLKTLEDTGLSKLAVSDLVLKTLYFKGDMTGYMIQESLRLPFTGILDGVMEFIKREKLVEIIGAGGMGEIAFRYQISSKGI